MKNKEFELAEQFALYTQKSFFLTGKAGSGKTTLLRHIASSTRKNTVIVAPTGVAAINAGGVTIHSMFGLPLTAFIPSGDYADPNTVTNRRALLDHLKMRKEKIKVLREMELLVIDEVSMVRADILDAIDFVLRTIRRNREPMGGVQVMLIGDMHQLPPVVKDNEWQILKNYYIGPYFFYAHVWPQLNAAEIELKKIYRQSDERFLQLLNNIRHRELTEDDFALLQNRYKPDFYPQDEGYILLATHNNKADSVNAQRLHELPGRMHVFEADLSGEFPENMYPCERELKLKEGAQVMFIRNDAEEGKYYNGKLAVVKNISGTEVTVTFNDSGTDYLLRKETWENFTYRVEEGTEKLERDVQGSFKQFPLRLAWAVTIHKSQGLTFDKVIIDAGQSFAAGQVYVALSRCTTLDGIVLHSLITPRSLHSDERINAFTESHHSSNELSAVLDEEKRKYALHELKKLFSFLKLTEYLGDWKEALEEKDLPDKEKALQLWESISAAVEQLISTSEKFQPQLLRLINDSENGTQQISLLRERCEKAIAYFTDKIFTELIQPLHTHIQSLAYKTGVKRYVQMLQAIQQHFWLSLEHLYAATFNEQPIYTSSKKYTREMLKVAATSTTTGKKEKGGTYRDTLTLYREGKSMDEIAAIRSLTKGTIEGHFAKLIQKKEVNVYDLLPPATVNTLLMYMQQNEVTQANATRAHFGEKFTYGEINMVLAHYRLSLQE